MIPRQQGAPPTAKPTSSVLRWVFLFPRLNVCGAEGTRTPNPLLAKQMRYQLRHGPRTDFA